MEKRLFTSGTFQLMPTLSVQQGSGAKRAIITVRAFAMQAWSIRRQDARTWSRTTSATTTRNLLWSDSVRLKMITEYNRDGYHATLVRSERLSDTGSGMPRFACIYERTKAGAPPHWEVLILYGIRAGSVGGREFPDRLQVPSPEMFGKRGWVYLSLARAERKHNEIVCSDQAAA